MSDLQPSTGIFRDQREELLNSSGDWHKDAQSNYSHKHIMKNTISLLCAALALTSCGTKQNQAPASKSLVVYYSQTGATKQVAELIAAKTNADIDSILLENPYTGDFGQTIARCQEEMQKGEVPAVKTSLNVANYDTIYVGYPVWFGIPAQPMNGWLKAADLKGKVVVPFCTFGSGGNTSIENVKAAAAGATVLNYYGVRNARVAKASVELDQFLSDIKTGNCSAPKFGEQEAITDETKAIFDAACGSYQMPLGTPVSVAVNGTDYLFVTESQSPDGAVAQAKIYVTAPAGAEPEFTRVDR